MAEEPPRTSSTTARPMSTPNERSEKAGPTSSETAAEKKPEKAQRGKAVWTQVGIRSVFFLTAAALLGLAGYIAGTAGTTHIEKVYAAVFATAALAIITDILAFTLLMLRPRAAPAVCPLDGVTIILAAVSIPSVIGSNFQTSEDGAAWKLAVVIIAERLLSIVICIVACVLDRRKKAEEHKPQIFDQKRMSVVSSPATSRRTSMMTTSTSGRTPNTRSVAHSIITEESEV